MVAEIVGNDGASKASAQGENRAVLVWKGAYEPGDRIRFQAEETGCFYVIQADDVLGESLVYLTAKELEFEIPFEEKKTSYNPKAYAGDIHYLYIRKARPEEWEGCRNLALNPMDQHGDRGCFPHAWANVETRGEAVFAARNAIDGVTANASHGAWPYESWGINRRDDAEFTLEFGRPVDIKEIVLHTRADFPHDNWWIRADIEFSDGSEEQVSMEKSSEPHPFSIKREKITWLKLKNLIKADDPSPFPALTQIEVWGRESGR